MTAQTRHQRWPEIDLIKAVSILAVILIHSISSGMGHQNRLEKVLGTWALFAVPSFLFAAGFLFDKTDRSTWLVARKLVQRLLPPYLFWSVVMLGLRALRFGPTLGLSSGWQLLAMFAFGQTGNIYYFIFVIGYLYTFSLWLRHWPLRWISVLWCVELLSMIVFYARLQWFMPKAPDLFWPVLFRHPIVHTLPYLTGWLVAVHYDRIRSWLAGRARGIVVGVFVADVFLVGLLQVVSQNPWVKYLTQIHIYVWLFGLICTGIRFPSRSRTIRFLSASSYAIYLIHFPLTCAVAELWKGGPFEGSVLAIVVTWSTALIATVMIIVGFQRLLGKRSRVLIGA